jgi:hypothetical protein
MPGLARQQTIQLVRQQTGVLQQTTAKFDDKRQKFSRVEFITALVSIAIKKYIDTKELTDVAEAISRLMTEVIVPKLRKGHTPPAEFRMRHLYSKAVSDAVSAQLPSIKAIFDGLVGRAKARRHKLLNIDEWLAFLRAARMIGPDLSERDACLAFAWSRMGVVDARTELGHLRSECVPLEGFIEALCRVSALKAMPSDQELAKAGGGKNAATFFEELRVKDNDAYTKLLKERSRSWGSEPSQSLDRCITHFLCMLIHALVPAATTEVRPADMKVWMEREMTTEDERAGVGKQGK